MGDNPTPALIVQSDQGGDLVGGVFSLAIDTADGVKVLVTDQMHIVVGAW